MAIFDSELRKRALASEQAWKLAGKIKEKQNKLSSFAKWPIWFVIVSEFISVLCGSNRSVFSKNYECKKIFVAFTTYCIMSLSPWTQSPTISCENSPFRWVEFVFEFSSPKSLPNPPKFVEVPYNTFLWETWLYENVINFELIINIEG